MIDCPDCRVKPDEPHEQGCEVARCPECGGQRAWCECPVKKAYRRPSVWSGEWPGAAECREYGFWCRPGPRGPGGGFDYLPCAPGDPGAQPDLTRLVMTCAWDRKRQRFVRPGKGGGK